MKLIDLLHLMTLMEGLNIADLKLFIYTLKSAYISFTLAK